MRIGLLKEPHPDEKRVAIVPAGVDALVKSGHTVFIEAGAGVDSHYTDEEYRKVGGSVVYNTEEVYQRSEIVVRITPFGENEIDNVQEEQIIFSALHLAIGKKATVEKLLKKRVTAIAIELIEKDNQLPILQSMGEIAGQIAIQVGERYLGSDYQNSRGILLGGIAGVAPAAVTIVGAGVVGANAAFAASSRGAHVIVLDKDIRKLRSIRNEISRDITTVTANQYTIARGVKYADLLIGAIQIKGEKTPHVITEQMVKTMKKGSVIVDVAIDQGGCVETSHPTSISNPIFEMHGVIHYCVPNMPAMVARTASFGMSNACIEYIQEIADHGLSNALLGDAGLAKGVCAYNGYVSNEHIADAFKLEYRRLRVFSTN